MGYASDIAQKLAEMPETVCEKYLPNGRRKGAWYVAGDVDGGKGGSLIVRVRGDRSRIGKWRDTNPKNADHHGNLLNLIQLTRRCTLVEAIREAEKLIGNPESIRPVAVAEKYDDMTDEEKRAWAARIYRKTVPIERTMGEKHLASRGLDCSGLPALRFNRNAYYRDDDGELRSGPAMIAAIRNADGVLRAVHRTWFDTNGVILRKMAGPPGDGYVDLGGEGRTVLVGEGIETVLSFRGVFEGVRLQAVLTASRLACFEPPANTDCILVAVDRDAAGLAAAKAVRRMADALGIGVRCLVPKSFFNGADFNDDLRTYGRNAMSAHIRSQTGARMISA